MHLDQLDPAELGKLPSTIPPPGKVVDFDGANPLETTSITVTSVFIILSLVFIGVGAYTKIKILRKGSWDDRTSRLMFLEGRDNVE